MFDLISYAVLMVGIGCLVKLFEQVERKPFEQNFLKLNFPFSRHCRDGNDEVKRPSSAYLAYPALSSLSSLSRFTFYIHHSTFYIPPNPTQSPHATPVSPHPKILF